MSQDTGLEQRPKPKPKIAVIVWLDKDTRPFLQALSSDVERILEDQFAAFFLNYGEDNNETYSRFCDSGNLETFLGGMNLQRMAAAKVVFSIAPGKELLEIDQVLESPDKAPYLAGKPFYPFNSTDVVNLKALKPIFDRAMRGDDVSVQHLKASSSYKTCGGWTLFGGGLTAVIAGALLYGLMSMGMLALSLSPAVYALLIIGAVMAVSSTLCIYPSVSSQPASKI